MEVSNAFSDETHLPTPATPSKEALKSPPGCADVRKLRGQYVKRKAKSRGIYLVDGYDRSLRKWQLTDVNDINRAIYVKPGTLLFTDFEY